MTNNKVKIIIEYIPAGDSSIDYNALESSQLKDLGNNISNPTVLNTAHTGGIRPFIWDSSKWDDGSYFWGNDNTGDIEIRNGRQVGGPYNGFWSSQISDSSGNFIPPLSFTIIGSNIETLTISFDKFLNEFATGLTINNQFITNDKVQFVWEGSATNQLEVEINSWNIPNKQAKITSILVGLEIIYDSAYIERGGQVVAGSRKTFNNQRPSYGIVPQYGRLSLIDINGNIDELNELGLLKDGLSVKILLNNEMLGDYRLEDVDFIGDRVNADLTDDILEWGSIFLDGIVDDENNTALTIFDELNAIINNTINITQNNRNYLDSIKLPDASLEPDYFSAAINMFCWATLTKVRKSKDGEIWLTR